MGNVYILGVRVGWLLAACYRVKTQNAMKSWSRFFKRFLTTQSSPPISQLCTTSLPNLQEYSGPYQVKDSKQDVFIIVLPIKEVIGDADQRHWKQGQREILEKTKVECQTFTKVMPDIIYIMKDKKEQTSQLSMAPARIHTVYFISEV